MNRRVVVTGMSVNTAIGDTLDGFRDALMAGRSAISQWKAFATDGSTARSAATCRATTWPPSSRADSRDSRRRAQRLRKLVAKVPWTTKLSMLLAADGWRDAGLFDSRLRSASPGGGRRGPQPQRAVSVQHPHPVRGGARFIDGMTSLYSLDTDHAGCVSEVLQARGPIYTAAPRAERNSIVGAPTAAPCAQGGDCCWVVDDVAMRHGRTGGRLAHARAGSTRSACEDRRADPRCRRRPAVRRHETARRLQGRPLLSYAVEAMLAVPAITPCHGLLGHAADEIRSAVDFAGAETVVWDRWGEGQPALAPPWDRGAGRRRGRRDHTRRPALHHRTGDRRLLDFDTERDDAVRATYAGSRATPCC